MLQKFKNHHTISNAFSSFAELNELVYFGDVNQDDSALLYKGITFSKDSTVKNYVHGTKNGYDLTSFTRSARYTDVNKNTHEENWSVIAIHLKTGDFPHLIFDAKKHDKVFYNSIFTRYPHMRRSSVFMQHMAPGSLNVFDLYMQPSSVLAALTILDDLVLQTMQSSYPIHDVELDGNILYIFKRGAATTHQQLSSMLEEGLWLAETFEYRHAYAAPTKMQTEA
jgi:hypothetical protein